MVAGGRIGARHDFSIFFAADGGPEPGRALAVRAAVCAAVCAAVSCAGAAGGDARAQVRAGAPGLDAARPDAGEDPARQTAAERESAPAAMLERARELAHTALSSHGSQRVSGIRAALDTLIDIVQLHPRSDIALHLRNGKRIGGMSIVDLSTLLDG